MSELFCMLLQHHFISKTFRIKEKKRGGRGGWNNRVATATISVLKSKLRQMLSICSCCVTLQFKRQHLLTTSNEKDRVLKKDTEHNQQNKTWYIEISNNYNVYVWKQIFKGLFPSPSSVCLITFSHLDPEGIMSNDWQESLLISIIICLSTLGPCV